MADTDRKLLEMAAKAAGVALRDLDDRWDRWEAEAVRIHQLARAREFHAAELADVTAERDQLRQYLEAAQRRGEELRAQVAALEVDAGRYRWLRLPGSNVPISHEAARDSSVYDAAIDAARGKA